MYLSHSIGYPVVTMSFLVKHQIMHVIRQRQQKRVAEENSVYFDILQKALPQESPRELDENHIETKNCAEDGAIAVTSSSAVQSDREGKAKVSPKSSQGGKAMNRERMGSSSGGGRHGKSSSSRTQDRSNAGKSQSQTTNDTHAPSLHGTGTVPVQNGDVPRPSSAGKVHVVGGKKQLAVKAVPRSNQPPQTSTASSQTATVQDTVKDKVCVRPVCVCVCEWFVCGMNDGVHVCM